MSPINPKTRLLHILEESNFLLNCKSKYSSAEELANNKFLSRATTRSIEIIGEAIKGLPEKVTKEYSNIPWKKIARMRDKLIHRYFEVDYNIVDSVVQDINPKFNQQIKEILDKLYRDNYLKLKQKLCLEEVDKSLFYSTKLNKLKNQDVIVAKMVIDTYPSNAIKIAIEEAKKIIMVGEYISTIDSIDSTKREEQISEIIQQATKINSREKTDLTE